jgi:high affinity Mn2+ porin
VWGFGGGKVDVESAANQLAGTVDTHRLTLTAGNVSVIDLFDANAYSHDPRTQFINWSIMTHGAYDFAADSRGYTWGLALEYVDDAWVLRGGRFVQPRESNGLALDPKIQRRFGDQLELEHAHQIGGLAGKVRLLVFRNVTNMGAYADALVLSAATGTAPAVADVRRRHAKIGMAFSGEQALSADTGVFARASWADGKTETYAFAEIDRSLSAGVLIKGTNWSRPADNVGVALVRNGLSSVHRQYLSAGGLGFFVGDGILNYRPELIAETFYNVALGKSSHIGANWQRIYNPAYNRDRGPVSVFSVRLHSDF